MLFLGGVHPDTPASAVPVAALERLLDIARSLLQTNVIEGTPAAIHTYRSLRRTAPGSDHDDNLWVYGRKGKPCRQCGTPIESKKMGVDARTTYWCPIIPMGYDLIMASTYSFDVTSTIDLPEVDNAVNQARKEIGQRFDFKGSIAAIDLDQKANTLTLTAEDNFKLESVWDVLQTRLIKRSVPVKNMKREEILPASGSTVKQVITLQQGIPSDAAREIVKHLKDLKMKKVQAQIQADQLRVSSPSKDELQAAMAALRAKDFGIALQFGNYRS